MSERSNLLPRRPRNILFKDPKRIKQYEDFHIFMDQYKMDQGCQRCGYNEHPAALVLDHRDQAEKVAQISCMYTYTWAKIHAEIAKCDVLCANCHQVKTYETAQHGWRGKARALGRLVGVRSVPSLFDQFDTSTNV